MVTKHVLAQYIDLQKELSEVENRISRLDAQIERIESQGCVKDKVMGGEGGLQPFQIEGFPYPEYTSKRTLLLSSKLRQEELEVKIKDMINEIEAYIFGIEDSHMRRIASFRVIDGLSWSQVAVKIGGGNTDESVKKAFYRYLEKN